MAVRGYRFALLLALTLASAGVGSQERSLIIAPAPAPGPDPGRNSAATAAASPGAAALAAATARVRDSESAARLTAEGQALYEGDKVKQTPIQYGMGGAALAERGEFREAIRVASRALFLGTSTRNETVIAFAKKDLALSFLYSGHLDTAERYASEALKHFVPSQYRNYVHGGAHKILGDVALKRGDTARAIKFFDDAIDYAYETQRFFARASLASAYVAAGQFDKAKGAIDKAESFIGVIGPRFQQQAKGSMLRIRAALAFAQGKPAEAAQLYEAALAAPSAAADADDSYDRFWILDGLGRARLAQGDKPGALKAYLEAIDGAEKIRGQFRSQEVKSGLFGEMQDVFAQAVQLLMETGQPERAWEVSERSRSRALLDLIRNRVQISSGSEVYTDPFGKPVKVGEVSARLKPGEAVIAYHVLAGRSYAWAIRSSGISAVTIDIGRAALAQQVEQYRDAVIEEKPAARAMGAKLYDALVKPLALADDQAVAFIPHESLHYLPFQALSAGDKHLIQSVAVSYAPSGSALVELAARQTAKAGKFFALGNPDLGDPKLALPGAQREVETLKAMFPDSEAYFLKEATRERLVAGAPQSRLIHVAAHGTVDAVDPLYSKLHLAGSKEQPGALEARDVYAMKFDASALVVLSACETGLGKVTRGDEIWGFTRSFLSAGAPALVVSLWQVSDESTEMMMKRFYAELNKGADARRALRAAQLEVMQDRRFAAPYYWSAFNLVGDSR